MLAEESGSRHFLPSFLLPALLPSLPPSPLSAFLSEGGFIKQDITCLALSGRSGSFVNFLTAVIGTPYENKSAV